MESRGTVTPPKRWQRARLIDPTLDGPRECWVEIDAPFVGTGHAYPDNKRVEAEPSYRTHLRYDDEPCYVCAADVELLPIFADDVELEVMPPPTPTKRRRRRGGQQQRRRTVH